jgi:hypothetical protein
MATRLCVKCKAAENPLGRLRFKKSRVDGQVYCENCSPMTESIDTADEPEVTPVFAPPVRKPSAGYVVIDCPDCAGGSHRPHQKPCSGCAGYGAVRIEAAMLNVYRPKPVKAPEILVED